MRRAGDHMKESRIVPVAGVMSQEDQALNLVQTGDHTEPNEAELLEQEFGAPDENGVYGAGEVSH
jgi:hypothetical protein